jgi:anthranilate/para-aminobenzoate synthase component I
MGEEGFTSTMDEATYMQRVRQAKEYIASGDAYQIVVSRRLDTELQADPFTVYRALRTINPSPYLFFLRLGKTSIVGSSPEVLVRLEDDRVEERPIAGTHPRGRTEAEDDKLAAEMQSDPKERAEHVMLVDLGRNDVGRVSRIGSVEVSEFMVIERYSHVMHLVSHVRGRLEPGRDAFHVLEACFPAGTLTGAPKIRPWRSSKSSSPPAAVPYGGAVGTFVLATRLCITIRTVVATAAAPRSRWARASWPTPTPRRSGSRPAPSREACCWPSASPKKPADQEKAKHGDHTKAGGGARGAGRAEELRRAGPRQFRGKRKPRSGSRRSPPDPVGP